jgi:hypothetical protein
MMLTNEHLCSIWATKVHLPKRQANESRRAGHPPGEQIVEKILVALLITAALAGCSQTTRPTDEKQAACAYSGLSADDCAKSKYGIRPTTQPSIASPST